MASVTNWIARCAYSDWRRIDFPDGFAFPCGTNLLSGVTLMAWGEIHLVGRGVLAAPQSSNNEFAFETDCISTGEAAAERSLESCVPGGHALPMRVSLEPGASSFAHGLTSSNTYLFAWTDACVEREATNRVDAAIELFASGDVQVRFGEWVTNIVARPPEGFVGIGQDTNWVAAAFSSADIAAITNKGYEAWLMKDRVGHNDPNGRYKLSVTVAALPEQGPCYLVCGPYRMVVTSPGTYGFPLIDMTEYDLYTCPTAVP